MQLRPFSLERYFNQHEFSARHLLGSSDPESLTVSELRAIAPELSLDDVWLGYTESAGLPALREAIAARYTTIAPKEVLVCSGAEEPIFALMNVLLAPGDEVVAHTPGYGSHFEVARAIGAEVTAWRGDPDDGWRLDPERLATLLTPRTKLVVVSVPHNPTGFLFDHAAWQRVIALVRAHGAWLLSDEVYRGLEHDPAMRLPAACDEYERAISLDGLSKSYALPGLRIGWLATHDASVLARVAAFKDYLTICNAAPSERLALGALAHAETLFARSRQRLVANRALLAELITRHPARFAWQPPSAGSTAFVRVHGGPATPFCEALLAATGVMLVPGPHFDWADTHVRFGYGRASFATGLAVLDRYLDVTGT